MNERRISAEWADFFQFSSAESFGVCKKACDVFALATGLSSSSGIKSVYSDPSVSYKASMRCAGHGGMYPVCMIAVSHVPHARRIRGFPFLWQLYTLQCCWHQTITTALQRRDVFLLRKLCEVQPASQWCLPLFVHVLSVKVAFPD